MTGPNRRELLAGAGAASALLMARPLRAETAQTAETARTAGTAETAGTAQTAEIAGPEVHGLSSFGDRVVIFMFAALMLTGAAQILVRALSQKGVAIGFKTAGAWRTVVFMGLLAYLN